MTDKEIELVHQLIQKTADKAIPWEPTARENEFVAPFKGHATFTVSKYESASRYGDAFRLIMRDPENREMLVIDADLGFPGDEQLLRTLYGAAHDSALKVEETLDAILDDLKRAS